MDSLKWIFGTYKLNVSYLTRITTIMYDFLPVLIFRFFKSIHIYIDENTLKTSIKRNILPTDPNKKVKLIHYNKFKTFNLVIDYNSSPAIGVLQKKLTLYINLNIL